MSRYSRLILGLGMVAVALGGCDKVKNVAGGGAPSEPALVTAAPGPSGMTWERADQPGVGSLEVPSGSDWHKEGGASSEFSNEKLGLTVMVQRQAGVPAEARKQFISSLIDVNKRDAPKYEVTGQGEGSVSSQIAGRVDGKFDNGKAYATRDYVLFVKDSALAVMVRGPLADATSVQAVADHMALSFK